METACAVNLAVSQGPTENNGVENALGNKQKKALEIIQQKGPIAGKVLAKQIKVAEATLRRHIIPPLRPHGVKNDGEGYYFEAVS